MSNHLDYEINKELGECYLFMGELDKAEDYYTKAAARISPIPTWDWPPSPCSAATWTAR